MSVSFDLTTPAFIGGPETRKTDEFMPLRPGSVRGVLRYWFRAAVAPKLDWRDWKKATESLKKIETEIFGSTENASALMVLPPKRKDVEPLARSYPPPDRSQSRGLRYLGYGLFEGRGDNPKALFPPGMRDPVLTLRFALRGKAIEGLDEVFAATVWLWANLGGLGARSRRGWGGLSLREVSGETSFPFDLNRPASREDLLKRLEAGLRTANDCFDRFLDRHWRRIRSEKHDSSIPVRTFAGIGSLKEPPHVLPADFPSWEEALETAGRLFQDYRSTLERKKAGLPPLPDYFEVKRLIQNNAAPKTVDRASFGLPLPFYFRSLGGKRATFKPRDGDRMPSPLLFRVFPLSTKRVAVVLINLIQQAGKSVFLGQDLIEQRRKRTIASPDGRIIEHFVAWAYNEVKRSPQAKTGRW